jgi:peroxiredoxin
MTMTANGPKPVTTDELFKGKTVALFAVPGAFTPTCSVKHLPGFKDKADALRSRGVDAIVGVAVNDVFVMGAWAKAEGISDELTLISDGNAEFTRAIGLEMDAARFGMGTRSQRYSMLVRDGRVEQLNVEEGGEFRVSSAEHLLGQLSA